MAKIKICIACNEDGVGPSTFAHYLVRAIIEALRSQQTQDELEIWIFNHRAYNFNYSIYSNPDKFVNVKLIDESSDPDEFNDRVKIIFRQVDSLIILEKPHGEVDVGRTLVKLESYTKHREEYYEKVQPYLQDCCVAIDIGVPLFALSANRMGIPNLTLFDHSWACTLRGICSREAEYTENPPTDEHRELAEKIAREIESDEKCTSGVILFDKYITPPEFRWHWERLGFTPTILKRVLGSGQNEKKAREKLEALIAEPVSDRPDLRQESIPNGRKLVLISPGGTPVWEPLWPKIVESYHTKPRNEFFPILSLAQPKQLKGKYKTLMKNSQGIRWIGPVRGGTLQDILPAFDLVVTRASGGTLNDWLASQRDGIPRIVCVEERQWQIKLIERECKALNMIPGNLRETQWNEFRKDPPECIDKFFDSVRPLPSNISGGVENDLANLILSWCRVQK